MALHKPAWQDSTHAGHVASRAVDGNDNTYLGANSCSHTDQHTYSTWGVDLQVMAIVYSTEILRRDYVNHGKYFQLYHTIL